MRGSGRKSLLQYTETASTEGEGCEDSKARSYLLKLLNSTLVDTTALWSGVRSTQLAVFDGC